MAFGSWPAATAASRSACSDSTTICDLLACEASYTVGYVSAGSDLSLQIGSEILKHSSVDVAYRWDCRAGR